MRTLLAVAVTVLALAAPAEGASWTSVSHPSVSGQRTIFTSADASGNNDVWAAGYIFGTVGGALEFRTMVQHWNGVSWTRANTVDRETAPAKDLIWDVSAPAGDDVWIVGNSARTAGGGSSMPLVEHFDGSSWQIVNLPRQDALESLAAVAASPEGEVWAAGDKPNPASGYYQPLLWHRTTAGAWSETKVPKVPGCRTTADGAPYEMYPMAASQRTGSLWLSGWCRTATDRSRGWLLHRNRGGGWQTVIGPDALPANSRLEGLDIAPGGQVRVVGSSDSQALSFKVGGTTVTPETVPGNPPLEDVAAGSGGVASAVGYMSIVSWVNGRWGADSWSTPPGVLNAVAREPNGVTWAFGDAFDDTGLVLRRN